jgi:phospholipase/carboxylesterase
MVGKLLNNKEISPEGWVMRIHLPPGNGPFPVLLMLHGWTGDENSMWVFTSRLPDVLVIAPRGLYAARSGGFSWHPQLPHPWPAMNDFIPSLERLFETISTRNFPAGDFSNLHLIGFSQGTAMAYAMTLMYPERIASLAGLSGFMPEGASGWLKTGKLAGLPVFVAHGTKDDLVPVEKARKSVELLEDAGAAVTYCEDDVGHKLSTKCFHGLEAFYQRLKY